MLKMEHRNAFWFLLFLFLTTLPFQGKALSNENVSPVVEKHQRKTLIETEYGSVSAVEIQDGFRPPYHLQFFTLDPNSLFLPVLLHADMVFYVHTGNGKLFWAEEDDGISSINIRPGDITRLKTGSVFYLQSNLDTARQKLRIFAMFPSTDHNNYDPSIGAYSRINELFRGFDKRIMQAALQAPEELVEAITNKTETPAIVHAVSKEQTKFWELEVWFLNSILGREIGNAISSNGKKLKSYNIFDNDPDFQNCYGWSLTVTHKQLKSLKPTNIGLLMVNLTAGSMMGPHWNPGATEIIMVLQGEGMVRVVCGSSYTDKSKCQNMRFKVKEGDIFLVPRFHPMAQMSFNNDSLVFMGFSTTVKKTYPQFLAGKKSVFQTIDKHIMATSLNVTKTTIEQLLDSQGLRFAEFVDNGINKFSSSLQ
ncbi:vicilin-like seed storage protein [Senna tora]|uniref:Vicilin-like seed storage protein n=1 Tax=Senna tora TaxID=362788 RepID=A0A834WPQ2_9FABA|nr:vicilin-like seed storage protein [Senna tora]